jgi:hypothetical protein
VLFVSTRKVFQRGDEAWDAYIQWIGLPRLQQVRTVDAALNERVDECGSVYCNELEIPAARAGLPEPRSSGEYYLLATKVTAASWNETFAGFDFFGCDLSDETMTSSLLNCGPWTGALRRLADRLNSYGLLSIDDALEAQKLLATAWGPEEPHALADVWAVYGWKGARP